jgi:hypothetical protein
MSDVKTKIRSGKKGQGEHHKDNSGSTPGASQAVSAPRAHAGPYHPAGPVFHLDAPVQARLVVGQKGDRYEREADAVAEHVTTGGPAPAISHLGAGSLNAALQRIVKQPDQKVDELVQDKVVQRQAVEDNEQAVQKWTLQRQEQEVSQPPLAQNAVERVQTTSGTGPGRANAAAHGSAGGTLGASDSHAISHPASGLPLHAGTRHTLESRLGVDLGSVRVHTGASAQQANTALRARAFTHKDHIWLGRGESQQDLGLMAHETAHVLQQQGVVRRLPMDSQLSGSQPLTTEPDRSADGDGQEPRADEANPAAASSLPQSAEQLSSSVPYPVIAQTTESMDRASGETETRTELDHSMEASTEAAAESAPVEQGGAEAEPLVSAAETSPATAEQAEEAARLQAVTDRVNQAAAQQEGPAASSTRQTRASHGAAVSASAAAPSPTNEAQAMGQASQVNAMNDQQAGAVDQQSFLALVRQRLAELPLPANPHEMDGFSQSGGAAALRHEVMGGVTAQTQGAQRDIRRTTEAAPIPAATRQTTPLQTAAGSDRTGDLRAEEALPVPRRAAIVSGPLEENVQAVDNRRLEAHASEGRLERVNDPLHAELVDAQQAVHDQAASGTAAYRQEEQATLSAGTSTLRAEAGVATQSMEHARSETDQTQASDQHTAMSQEQVDRQHVSDQVEAIYNRTQQAVEEKLTWLDGEVDQRFTDGEARARQRFETFVSDGMSSWKWERYGSRALIPIVGTVIAAGTWIYDQWVGIDQFPEIIRIFDNGRAQYLAELDTVIVDIGTLVDDTLTWCKERIQHGRDEIQEYVDGLPETLRQVGEETAANVSNRFDQLRTRVESHRSELANHLAQRYQESSQALNERITALQAENSGLQADFERVLNTVLDAIQNFRDMLPRLARNIPGYTLFTVLIGENPLTGEEVPSNATNLVQGLLELVPFGAYIFDALQERGVIQEAFQWVEGELGRLDLSRERIETTIDAAWEDIHVAEGIDYNLEVLTRHFSQLLIDVTSFAASLVDYLIELIKRTALEMADELLAENQAWSLTKKILHYDPLKDLPVEASTAEIVADFLTLIGKEQELEQMREKGTLDETAAWLDTQVGTFLSLLDELGGLFSSAWEAIQPENLPNLPSNLRSIADRAVGFLGRVWDFALTVAAKVLELIKDALLTWLAAHANTFPGYHLLTVILEKDVFTQEAVPRTPTNLIRGFMSLLSNGEQQFQQLQTSGVIPEAAQRIEGAINTLGISWEFIRDLFQGIWDSLSIDDLIDPIGAFVRIMDRFGEPLGRLLIFVAEVFKVVLELILRLMHFPFELVDSIINNAMHAFEDIQRDPVAFIMNMLAAVKLGFSNFFDHILTYLMSGLTAWLFRGLRQAGVEPPADFSLGSVLRFVLDVLGINMEHIWEKLAEHIGQPTVDRIRGALDMLTGIWNFVRDVQERGVAAIWEYIQSQISNLWSMLLDKAMQWIMEKIVTRATARLLSMLDPTGVMAVVNSFVAFFNAVQSAIEYLNEILAIVNDYVSTIAAVARGEIQPGADKMEQGLAHAIPIAIGFLANQVGLGDIGSKMAEIIGGIRAVVDRALDWLIDQAVRLGSAILRSLGLGGEEEVDTTLGEQLTFGAGDHQHSVWIETSGTSVTVMVASNTPSSLETKIHTWIDTVSSLPEANRNEARGLLQTASQELQLTLTEAEQAKLAINQAEAQHEAAAIATAHQQDEEAKNAESQLVPTLTRLFNLYGEAAGTNTPVLFGSLVHEFGSSASVAYLQSPHDHGSDPSVSNTSVYNDINMRKQGNGSYYVKGHLLNENLGGPGNTWSNLTPLTQGANGQHKNQFENAVKIAVNGQPSGYSGTTLGNVKSFSVQANYGRGLAPIVSILENPALESPQDLPAGIDPLDMAKVLTAEQYVPNSLTCYAEITPQGGTSTPLSVTIPNEINYGQLSQYSLNAETKQDFVLADHIDFSQADKLKATQGLRSLSGIGTVESVKIYDAFKTSHRIFNYLTQIGITKKALEHANHRYRISSGVYNGT